MKGTGLVIIGLLTLTAGITVATEPENMSVAGSFSPAGPPEEPSRHQIGDACIVDLHQPYVLHGSLEGEMRIDFRIYVAGPCGSPPGTYDEHWIAYGSYSVRAQQREGLSGTLLYLADVSAGGDVDGRLTLAEDLQGSLVVRGNFEKRQMSYHGDVVIGSAK